MLNTVSIGDIGETQAIALFTKNKIAVSRPMTNNVRYDLIVDINDRLYRVQVKSTSAIKDGKMEFATKTTNYTKGSWSSNRYSTNEVDMFFLYCVENDWCGLFIPDEEIPSTLYIRTAPPKNNQKVGIRLMEDYSFDKQLVSLT